MDLVKLLPLIFSLLSRGGEVANIVKQILALVASVVAMFTNAVEAPTLDVKWLQTRLKELGYDAGPVDGVYGGLTKDAVTKFQTAKGLTIDGWAGPETLAALVAK